MLIVVVPFKYTVQGFPFKFFLFNENVVLKIKPLTWWSALEKNLKNLTKEMNDMVKQLFFFYDV